MQGKYKFLFLIFLLGMGALLSGCGLQGPAQTDDSLNLLQQLFGSSWADSLTCVASKTSSCQLNNSLVFPVLIQSFNLGIIGGALLIFSYIGIMGTLYTAQDGVFLGKKWAKTLIPLRAIIGVVAVFPIGSSGFCIAQYIIYGMATVGVNLANSVWSTVAIKASSGTLLPGTNQAFLQDVNTGVSESVFYNSLLQVIPGLSSTQGSSLGASNYALGVSNKPFVKISVSMNSPSGRGLLGASPSTSTQPTVYIQKAGYMYGADFLALDGLITPQTGTYTGSASNILNTVDVNSCTNSNSAYEYACRDVLNAINTNLSASSSSTVQVGNVSYAYDRSSAPPIYVQTVFLYRYKGSLSGLVAPPMNKANTGSCVGGDPVSGAYELASLAVNSTPPTGCSILGTAPVLSPTIMSASAGTDTPLSVLLGSNYFYSPSGGNNSPYQSAIGQIVDLALPNSSTTPVAPVNPDVQRLSTSWWYAGDEYLYLDKIFGESIGSLAGLGQDFIANATGAGNVHVNPVVDTNTYGFIDPVIGLLDFGTRAGGAAFSSLSNGSQFPSPPAVSQSSLPFGYYLWDNKISFSGVISGGSSLSLSDFLTAIELSLPSSGSSYLQPEEDLLCHLANLAATPSTYSSYCASLTGYSPDPIAYGNGVVGTPSKIVQNPPSPIDFSSGPYPLIQDYFYYYYLLATQSGKLTITRDASGAVSAATQTAAFEDGLYRLDLALNYVVDATTLATSDAPCPAGMRNAQCNSNSATWQNPMIIAGDNSPLGGVMGKIFSGLLGSQYGSEHVAGLLAQIWCVGEVDFSGCMQNVQSESLAGGSAIGGLPAGNGSGVVDKHFSVMANTQLVGMNLIAGTVAALTSVYTTFTDKLKPVLSSLAGKNQEVPAATMAGLVLLGPAYGASKMEEQVEAATSAMVAVAALSVNLMWIPVIMIVLTTLFTTGVMFSVFIPMLPFVLYWAGKIAWLLLVIEAIFAAPLMAMAMAYPEGHDLWGMGEQGFKISLNLFLMPVLMVVGLVSAMAITYYVLYITANGFHFVSYTLLQMVAGASFDSQAPVLSGTGLTGSSFSGGLGQVGGVNGLVAQGIMSTFLIFMYATFISMAFSKSFSTIYVIPERVMSWIGSQGMKFGEKEGGEMQGAVSKQADQAAQGGGQAVSQGTQAQKGLADSQINKSQQDNQSEIQLGQAGNQEMMQTIGTVASVAGAAK